MKIKRRQRYGLFLSTIICLQEISLEGKVAPILLCPILKEEMELKSGISRDLPVLRSVCDRNEETHVGEVAMKMKKSL